MSQAIATPTPATALRRAMARAWQDPDSRSVTIGILGVLFIHLLLFLLAPFLVRMQHRPAVQPHKVARQFDIELTPEMLRKPEPKPATQKQFVETNPDAPENTPDKTNNFAAQNQQVAQEKPTPNGESERPAMEGKKDFQSNQIVSGRLEKPFEQVVPPSPPETPPAPQTVETPRAEQNPLPGFDKNQGDNPNTFGSTNSTAQNNIYNVPNRIEGMKDAPIVDSATAMQPAIDPKHPRPRPSVVKTQQVRPAILAENKVGTSNVGVTAINAKFSEYGLYLQRMADAVQLQFDKLVGDGKTYPPVGSYVVVKFVLDSEGKIPRIVSVDNHSTDTGAQTCVSAITTRAPYGPWTDDMKAALNPDGEELIFSFYYQ
jgi:hypothetical protein